MKGMKDLTVKTIDLSGYELLVDFDYNPQEDSTFDYPGCSESIEINEAWIVLPEELLAIMRTNIEELILEKIREEQDALAERREE